MTATLDLCDLRGWHDHQMSMLDREAWDAALAEIDAAKRAQPAATPLPSSPTLTPHD